MSNSPNIQNSYGPEVMAYEYMQYSAPQASVQECPKYVVEGSYPNYQDAADQNLPAEQTPAEKGPTKRILGLSVPVFWTATILGVLILLGIGVGVGVGVGLSNQSPPSSPAGPPPLTTASTSSPAATEEPTEEPTDTDEPISTDADTVTTAAPTTSATTTTTAPVTSGTVGLSDNSCTFTTPRSYAASDGNTNFLQFCFTDWPNNSDADDGRGKIMDLRRLTLYTFEDCMEACVSYNEGLSGDATSCQAVTYNSNLTSIIAVGKQGGNCFLKNKKGVNKPGRAESASAVIFR